VGYCTVSDLRDEDLLADDADAARVQELIDEYTEQIDEWCGQFFEERSITVEAIGKGTKWLHLPVPIITVTEVRQVWHTSDPATTFTFSATQYRAFNRTVPNDRKNPKIQRLGSTWAKGGTFEVDGTFGWVVADGAGWKTPPQIRRACMLLVAHWAPRLAEPDAAAGHERRGVARVPGRQHAVEEVDAPRDGLDEIPRVVGGPYEFGVPGAKHAILTEGEEGADVGGPEPAVVGTASGGGSD